LIKRYSMECTELIGSWTVQYSDESQSTWVVEAAEENDSSVFTCFATGVKQTEGEADVDFRLYWMKILHAYFYTEDLSGMEQDTVVSVLDFKKCSFSINLTYTADPAVYGIVRGKRDGECKEDGDNSISDEKNWVKHVIADLETPIYLIVKDMDNDDDLDVIATTNEHGGGYFDSEVAWFENKGLDSTWEKHVISSNDNGSNPIQNSNGLAVHDMDGDGRQDVVVGTGGVGEAEAAGGKVYWFKAPAENTGVWQRFLVSAAEDTYFKMYTMDVDADGKEDIIAGGNMGTLIFFNPGDDIVNGAVWKSQQLPGVTGSSLYLDDMDGDGQADILNTHLGEEEDDYYGYISWFKVDNSGDNTALVRTDINEGVSSVFDVNAMDVNDDGKKDVVVTIFGEILMYWYEAPAVSGGDWTQHVISETFGGTDIFTGDINGDGKDNNMVVAGLGLNKISWFKPVATDNGTLWQEYVIDDDIMTPGDLSLHDLDNDGDLDLFVAGMGVDQMLWYENKPGLCPVERVFGRNTPQVKLLQQFRDEVLSGSPAGRKMIELYYNTSEKMNSMLGQDSAVLHTARSLLNAFMPMIKLYTN